MKNIIYLFLVLILAPFLIKAQPTVEWIRTYHGPANGGGIDKMVIDNNNYIYVSGQDVGSAVAYDIVTIKYNSDGDSLWGGRYSSGAQSEIYGVAVDDFGNVYVTGFTVISGQPRCITIKYSSSGEMVWEKLYDKTPDNRSIGLGLDQLGYVYIAGSSNLNGIDWGVEIVKYNPQNGDTIWTARYDQTPNSIDIPYAMNVDNQGNVYVTGYSQDAGIIKFMLVKYSSDGVYQWELLYNIPDIVGEIQGRIIKIDDEGNIYIAGLCYNGQTTFVDILLIKCYANGDTAWVRTYNNSNISAIDDASDLAIDDLGNVFVTGRSFIGGGGSNNYDYLTAKFSPDGNLLWHATYNGIAGPTQDEAKAIVLDQYGNCYVTGESSVAPLFNSGRFATVKYNSEGDLVWTIRHDDWGSCGASGIGIDSENNIYIAGYLSSSFATVKYLQPPVPVELTSFSGFTEGNYVILNWTTATEVNNSGFEIERQEISMQNSLSTWQKIGFVEGYGTTTEAKSYSFKDYNLSSGKPALSDRYLYRLKQIDFDGSFSYSDEAEVLVGSPGEFSLYQNFPNPFNPNTTIRFSIPVDASVKIKLSNSLGEQIALFFDKEIPAGSYSIYFSGDDLASGIYFYSIEVNGKDNTSFKSFKKMILLK